MASRTKVKLLGAALLAATIFSSCTVVSANRVFPKLDWYWSADAKEQRRERAIEKHPATNNVSPSK